MVYVATHTSCCYGNNMLLYILYKSWLVGVCQQYINCPVQCSEVYVCKFTPEEISYYTSSIVVGTDIQKIVL